MIVDIDENLEYERLRDDTNKSIRYTRHEDGGITALETGIDSRGRQYTRESSIDAIGRYIAKLDDFVKGLVWLYICLFIRT